MTEDLMKRHERTFGCKKPIIGCLHLRALPGSPRWDSSFSINEHIDLMLQQAHILMDLGYDAAVFANEADIPYVQTVSPAVVANYTRIVTEVVKELTIPFGIGVLLDPYATLSIANATGACFCRGAFSLNAVSNYGEVNRNPGEIWRYAKSIGAEKISVYTGIEAHSGTLLDTRTVEEKYLSGVIDLPIAGYIVSGPGKTPPAETVMARCKAVNPNIPIIFNNGSTPENVKSMLPYCDAVLVGTAIKKDGYLYNEIDRDRAERFIQVAKG